MKVVRIQHPNQEAVLDVANKLGSVIKGWTEENEVKATAMVVVVTLSDGSLIALEVGDDKFRLVGGLADAQNALLNDSWATE
jgi:hypothetical protein